MALSFLVVLLLLAALSEVDGLVHALRVGRPPLAVRGLVAPRLAAAAPDNSGVLAVSNGDINNLAAIAEVYTGGAAEYVADGLAAYPEDDAKERTLSVGGFASRLSDIVTKSKLWGLYSLSLTLRPIYTKALSSMLGFLIGDFMAQVFFVKRPFDMARFIRMGAFGAVVHAPFGHFFYGFLERRFPGVKVSALATKLAIDQIAWTPVFGALLFSFVGVTAGRSPSAIFRTIKNNLLKVVLTSWIIWPVAHTVNFKYITPKHRLLYVNSVQVVFNTFLSIFAAAGAR